MPKEILILLQFLVSCFLEPPPPHPRKQAGGSGHNRGTLKGLLLSMSQRHYLLSPSSCYPSQWGSSVLTLLCTKDQANENCEHQSDI